MSILFGVCQAEGHAVQEPELRDLSRATARFAPDGTYVCARGRVGMGFQPYHTHQRSNLESQPTVDVRGNMLTLDGRIDNYQELCTVLDICAQECSDSQIVLAAFARWGGECFSKLVGDWALALWSEADRLLYLARDHAGTRTLYYEVTAERILWSTYIESFFVDKKTREIDRNYAARYLSGLSREDHTPYMGIRAAMPAHYYVIGDRGISRRSHWQWMVKDRIRYRTDAEYEEHLFALLRQAVERRTGPGAPILAHLSGGMDSSSIVCMSDHIRKQAGASPGDLLDTISYYDDSEPSWDEKPYFLAVEAQRERAGHHVSASIADRTFRTIDRSVGQYAFPGGDARTLERESALEELADAHGYRCILSGIGGDELLGGVPYPVPELADCLVAGRIAVFLAKAINWSLTDRSPLLNTIGNVIVSTFQLYCCGQDLVRTTPPWLTGTRLISGEESEMPLTTFKERIGFRPSAVINGRTWWPLLETLPGCSPAVLARYEYRFPMLDRDLVDFLFRIPREQIIRPGQRKSLLRRSVCTIVPRAVLERKRKAHVSRGLILLLERSLPEIRSLLGKSMLCSSGLLDTESFMAHLASAIKTADLTYWFPIMRTLWMEMWWQSMTPDVSNLNTEPPASPPFFMCVAGKISNETA